MSKIYKQIVQSATEPDINCIWFHDGKLYYFDGGWKSVEDKVALENLSGQAIVKTPVIKLNNTVEDKQNNIQVCSAISTTEVISVDVEGTMYGITYDAIGIYHNGTVSLLEGDNCTVFDIDFNTGTVTLDSKYDTSRFLSYVDLQIGNSNEVKQYNMERLQIGPFFTNIDYGFGVGTWNPTSGGTAHIVTAYGNTVYYNISEDGIVTKEFEAPDLYYEYTMQGGEKSPEEFLTSLFELIG